VKPPVFEVVILGGGIAGACMAAQLAPRIKTLIVEKEDRLGRHASGRSTGMFIPSYGGPVTAALAEASRAFFEDEASDAGGPLLRARPVLHISSQERPQPIATAIPIHGVQVRKLCPILRTRHIKSAWLESGTGELDVSRLHQILLARATRQGAALWLGAGGHVSGHDGTHWRLTINGEELRCTSLVNAAGAWANEVAAECGVAPIGLKSYRRTAILIDPPSPEGLVLGGPIVKDMGEKYYFRPFGGDLLISPCDETPSPPVDAQPEEADVALAVARFRQATGFKPPRIKHKWAGLRSFAPDRLPVIGWDLRAPNLFWFAGLGGYGIQTAPAAGRLAADLFFKVEASTTGEAKAQIAQQFSPMRWTGRKHQPATV